MLIEDLTGRDEPVSVHCFLGFNHRFVLQEDGRKVCQVNNQEHIGIMLGSGNFREYIPSGSDGEEPVEVPAFDWDEWTKSWVRMGPEGFCGKTEMVDHAPKGAPPDMRPVFTKGFVHQNLDKFAIAPAEVISKARAKWARMSDGKIWPGKR